MPIPLPVLDDRRWTDLVEEARALIPAHSPEWTDHNAHDPGIMLAELLAWITEQDLFRLDRVSDRHRRKFLKLVGLSPVGPRAATTVLAFTATTPSPFTIPALTQFQATVEGESLVFQTSRAIRVVQTRLAGLWMVKGTHADDLSARAEARQPMALFGADAQAGSAFYFAFDQPFPPGEPVTLYFTFEGCRPDRSERTRIAKELRRGSGHRALRHHSVRLVWERPDGHGRWRDISDNVEDGTRALTLNGAVVLTLGAPMASGSGPGDASLFYLRCRIAGGAYDAPPLASSVAVNGVAARQVEPLGPATWPIAAGAQIDGAAAAPGALVSFDASFDAGKIVRLDFEAEGAPAFRLLQYDPPLPAGDGRITIEAASPGVGDGSPGQDYRAGGAIEEHGFAVSTIENDPARRWRRWSRRLDFDASRRADAHVVLDAMDGTFVFGDGERGRVADEGTIVVARGYRTAHQRGNVTAGLTFTVVDSLRNRALFGRAGYTGVADVRSRLARVHNVVPGRDGAPAETVDAAAARAARDYQAPHRAVTAGDLEAIALATPGSCLARVWARPNLHPAFPCVHAAGVVTVVPLPHLPAGQPSPSDGLRTLVAAYVNRRRLLGTRVEVTAPTYVEITVSAQVQAHAGSAAGALSDAIIGALERFFDPLRGGTEGTGWPLGRDVYRSEVLQVISTVAGVDHVIALELAAGDGPPVCGNVCIGALGLVRPGHHRITVVGAGERC